MRIITLILAAATLTVSPAYADKKNASAKFSDLNALEAKLTTVIQSKSTVEQNKAVSRKASLNKKEIDGLKLRVADLEQLTLFQDGRITSLENSQAVGGNNDAVKRTYTYIGMAISTRTYSMVENVAVCKATFGDDARWLDSVTLAESIDSGVFTSSDLSNITSPSMMVRPIVSGGYEKGFGRAMGNAQYFGVRSSGVIHIAQTQNGNDQIGCMVPAV